MHPLSVFPQLLYLGLLAPVMLRIVVGAYIATAGWQRYKKPHKWVSVIYGISGLFLIVGLFTQIAVIISILILGFDYHVDNKVSPISKDKKIIYILVGVILLTLLFTGPGLFAFDLPL